jgi:hypothetical protein
MPVWGALVGTLVLNYARHRGGHSTLCSSTRSRLRVEQTSGQLVFLAGWITLSGWLVPHLLQTGARQGRDGGMPR